MTWGHQALTLLLQQLQQLQRAALAGGGRGTVGGCGGESPVTMSSWPHVPRSQCPHISTLPYSHILVSHNSLYPPCPHPHSPACTVGLPPCSPSTSPAAPKIPTASGPPPGLHPKSLLPRAASTWDTERGHPLSPNVPNMATWPHFLQAALKGHRDLGDPESLGEISGL